MLFKYLNVSDFYGIESYFFVGDKVVFICIELKFSSNC